MVDMTPSPEARAVHETSRPANAVAGKTLDPDDSSPADSSSLRSVQISYSGEGPTEGTSVADDADKPSVIKGALGKSFVYVESYAITLSPNGGHAVLSEDDHLELRKSFDRVRATAKRRSRPGKTVGT